MTDREFDVVLYGATGYTGRLVAEYLFTTYAVGQRLRLALAGRSLTKLSDVRRQMDAQEQLPIIVADAHDGVALDAMCRRSRLVISTAGPFSLYGSALVGAAVGAGTDYVDIAGEANWLRAMIDKHADQAKSTGSRIVSSCGFDSIPSDLGVYFVQQAAIEAWGEPARRVRGRLRGASGGMSGGSIASGAALMEMAAKDASIWKLLVDPFALSPGFRGPEQPDPSTPHVDPLLGSWVAEFMLAPTDTKVVHRTNFLLGQPWGKDFLYDEMQVVDGRPEPGEPMFDQATLAQRPGDGPTKEQRESGFFDMLFIAESKDGRVIRASVKGDMDPGYGSTSKMLSEAALALAFDVSRDQVGGGFWTPASAMAAALLDRLPRNAGVSLQLE